MSSKRPGGAMSPATLSHAVEVLLRGAREHREHAAECRRAAARLAKPWAPRQ